MHNINRLPRPQRNYTEVPDVVFDEIMPRIKNISALKCYLLLIRKTWGFEKKGDWLSLSQLIKYTKLSKPSVIDGIRWLGDNGFIWSISVGANGKKRTMYFVCTEETEELEHLVKTGIIKPETVFKLSMK